MPLCFWLALLVSDMLTTGIADKFIITSILIKGRSVCVCVCLCVCLFAFSDQTIGPILTNDGSMKSLGLRVCHDGPRFLNFRSKPGKKGQKWPKIGPFQSYCLLLTKLLNRFWQTMALWIRGNPGDIVTGPKFWKSDPKLAKIAKNGPDIELLAFIYQTTQPIDFKLGMIEEVHPRSDFRLYSIFWMTSVPREWRHSAVWHLFLALMGRDIVRFPWKLACTQSNTQEITWAFWKKWVTSLNRKWRHSAVLTPFFALLGRGIVWYPRNFAHTESNNQEVTWAYWNKKNVTS